MSDFTNPACNSSSQSESSLAVCFGRFQPVHCGHVELLQFALEHAQRVLVILGSAFQSATPINPFDVTQRIQLLKDSLAEWNSELPIERLDFAPLRDYYDTRRWAKEFVSIVQQVANVQKVQPTDIALVGSFQDPTLHTQAVISQWKLVRRPRKEDADASAIRAAFFSEFYPDCTQLNPFRKPLSNLPMSSCKRS